MLGYQGRRSQRSRCRCLSPCLKPANTMRHTTSPRTSIGMPPAAPCLSAVNECRWPLVDVVIDLRTSEVVARRRSLPRMARSALGWADTIHRGGPPSKQIHRRPSTNAIAGGHSAAARSRASCLQDRSGPGLIEDHQVDGLCPADKRKKRFANIPTPIPRFSSQSRFPISDNGMVGRAGPCQPRIRFRPHV